MKRRTLLTVLAALPLVVHAQVPLKTDSLTSALKNPLMGALTSQLGVTEDQAKGGIGSYLTLLQEKLAKGDFDKIASLVPGASGYLETAKKLGAVTGPLKESQGPERRAGETRHERGHGRAVHADGDQLPRQGRRSDCAEPARWRAEVAHSVVVAAGDGDRSNSPFAEKRLVANPELLSLPFIS